MEKLITCGGSNQDERLFSRVIRPGPQLVKEASGELDPAIAKCIAGLKSSPDKIYILVNALGAGEYYGANYNSDYFAEDQLNPKDPNADYGYKTFMNAGIYRNHSNKDASKSYGKVICCAYNTRMHRVELVIEIDRKKCLEHGHMDLFDRLMRGEKPSVSMGCRVAYDVCSICKNQSRTREDYCKCCKDDPGLGHTLPNGQKVCVHNPKPKFFDLSIVVIGADRTSYVMAKVARAGGYVMGSAEAAAEAGMTSAVDRLRTLSKTATHAKKAEILKEIPATAAKVVPSIEGKDADIDGDTLDAMSAGGNLSKILTTSAAAGIVLKPQEFQHIVLTVMGAGDMAHSLSDSGSCFCPCQAQDSSIPFGSSSMYDRGLADIIRNIIPGRSMFGPPLVQRIVVIKTAARRRPVHYVDTPVLRKIAAAYNGYRVGMLEQIESIVANITERDVDLMATVHGGLLEDSLRTRNPAQKTASAPVNMALLGAVPLAYLYGAHTGGHGEQEKPADSFIAKHPVLAMSILVGLARLGAHVHTTGQLDEVLAKLAKD